MTNVRMRFGGKTYVLTMPDGSRLEKCRTGGPIVIIPGPLRGDTSTVLSPGALVQAARKGLYGLAVREPTAAVGV